MSDADPYALVLAQKDEEVRTLQQQLQGVQANFRNKIRSLQNELHHTRRLSNSSSAPGTVSAPASSSAAAVGGITGAGVAAPASGPAPALACPSGGEATLAQGQKQPAQVEELQREVQRLRLEVEQARAEGHAHSENLEYAQQELSKLRDRQRKLLASMHAMPTSTSADDASLSSVMPASALPPVVPALTQPGDVVEATQVPPMPMQAAASQAPTQWHGHTRSQGFNMRTAARPPSRRRRRPSTVRSGNMDASKSAGSPPTTSAPTANATATRKRRASAPDVTEGSGDGGERNERWDESRSGWGMDLGSDPWSEQALRRRLFTGRVGSGMLALATALRRDELGEALLAAMASDTRWPDVLPPLARVLTSAPRASRTALQAARVVLTFSEKARAAAALSAHEQDGFVAAAVRSLDEATRVRDETIARHCIRALHAAVDGAGEVDDGADAEAAAARVSGAVLSSDSALLWATNMGKGDAAEQTSFSPSAAGALSSSAFSAAPTTTTIGTGAEVTATAGDTDGDAGRGRAGGGGIFMGPEVDVVDDEVDETPIATHALRLLDAAAALAVEAHGRVPDDAWARVERAYAEAADVLSIGGGDLAAVDVALGMMARAAVHAPYLVNDFGGADGLCALCARGLYALQRPFIWELPRELREVDFGIGDESEQEREERTGEDACEVADRRYALGVVRGAVGTLALAAAGMGGKLDVAEHNRAVGLAALAVLAWPRDGLSATPPEALRDPRFREDCRKTWLMLSRTTKSDPGQD